MRERKTKESRGEGGQEGREGRTAEAGGYGALSNQLWLSYLILLYLDQTEERGRRRGGTKKAKRKKQTTSQKKTPSNHTRMTNCFFYHTYYPFRARDVQYALLCSPLA